TPNRYGCPLDHALTPSSTKAGQCLFSQVTLNTGTYPQVAVSSHGHSALVTPGGSGVVLEIEVTKPSTANLVRSASLSGGVVTVAVDTTQCPPGVSPTSSSTTNPCPLTMVPGFVGSVLITGLTAKNSANNALFNGVFTVSVTSNNTFRSEEHTSELQSRENLVCRLLLEKKKIIYNRLPTRPLSSCLHSSCP